MIKFGLFSLSFALSFLISTQADAQCTPTQPCLPGLIEEGDMLNNVVLESPSEQPNVGDGVETGADTTTQNETGEVSEDSAEAEPEPGEGVEEGTDNLCLAAIQNKDRMCTPTQSQDRSQMTSEQMEAAGSAEGILQTSQHVAGAATVGAVTNAIVGDDCRAAGERCIEECEKDARPFDVSLPAHAERIREKGRVCKEDAIAKANIYDQQVAGNLAARNNALQTAAAAGGSGDIAQGGAAEAPASSGGGSPSAPSSDPAPTSSGGGGGGNMMQGMVLGAAAGLGAMCLMGTLCDDGKKDEDEKSADMPVNCQKDEDAYQKSECKDYFLLQCTGYLSAPGCEDFSPYYCGISESEETSETSTASTYQQGAGSDYCQIVIASQYCERSGREACPSCQNLARMSSDACKENPSVCLPQMTAEDKQMAQNTCPTDPIFSDPQFASGGSSDSNSDSVPEGTGPASFSASASSYSHRGPASEVGRAVGPSVFSQTSEVIKKRCLQGRLNNCGMRSFTADEAFTH